jgi:hypothetical protein
LLPISVTKIRADFRHVGTSSFVSDSVVVAKEDSAIGLVSVAAIATGEDSATAADLAIATAEDSAIAADSTGNGGGSAATCATDPAIERSHVTGKRRIETLRVADGTALCRPSIYRFSFVPPFFVCFALS